MKHGSHQKRGRGGNRPQNRKNPANRNHDSQGPDVRIRGNAVQIYDKYVALARDASSNGDRVLAENYLQHAEHYCRIMLAAGMSPDKRRNQNSGTQDLGVPSDRKPKKDKSDDNNQEAASDKNAEATESSEETAVEADAAESSEDSNEADTDGETEAEAEVEVVSKKGAQADLLESEAAE